MKKNILLLIVAFIFTFCFVTEVDAYCSTKKHNALKALAYKAELNYELKFDENHNHYFDITVNNVDKDLLIFFNGTIYEPKDGTVYLSTRLTGGLTYEIKLYGGYDTSCVEEYLYTKKITVPTYNKYSERDECIEYEEFQLCNKWYSGYISGEDEFLERLNDYILTLEKTEKEEVPVKEKNTFEKIIDFYVEHLIITLPITIIIVLLIVYKVVVKIIRRKRRIKLNS